MQVETVRSRPLTLTETSPVASTPHTLITVKGIGARHTMTDTQAKPGKDNR